MIEARRVASSWANSRLIVIGISLGIEEHFGFSQLMVLNLGGEGLGWEGRLGKR